MIKSLFKLFSKRLNYIRSNYINNGDMLLLKLTHYYAIYIEADDGYYRVIRQAFRGSSITYGSAEDLNNNFRLWLIFVKYGAKWDILNMHLMIK